MKVKFLGIFFLFLSIALHAQYENAIKDESKLPTYTLPELLVSKSGKTIKNKKQWNKIRRPELIQLFKDEMYGNVPKNKNVSINFSTLEVNKNAVNGLATRKQINISFSNGSRTIDVPMLIYIPNGTTKPAPAFMGLNFEGNQTIYTDSAIIVPDDVEKDQIKFGTSSDSWQVERLIKRGYAIITACCNDFELDKRGFNAYPQSIRSLFYAPDEKPDSTQWGTIACWAYGLQRMLDYTETDADIDASKVAVFGHSRLGKAAVWAGACDQRFGMVISNNSGCGGAALSKRKYGESVAIINYYFPYWFCDNFKKYIENEQALPFDQHELLALVAPRPLYVASGVDDWWQDPKGEFLSAYFATPAYELFGKKGIPNKEMPPVDQPVVNTIAYHVRTGEHGIFVYDWEQYLNFADTYFKK